MIGIHGMRNDIIRIYTNRMRQKNGNSKKMKGICCDDSGEQRNKVGSIEKILDLYLLVVPVYYKPVYYILNYLHHKSIKLNLITK